MERFNYCLDSQTATDERGNEVSITFAGIDPLEPTISVNGVDKYVTGVEYHDGKLVFTCYTLPDLWTIVFLPHWSPIRGDNDSMQLFDSATSAGEAARNDQKYAEPGETAAVVRLSDLLQKMSSEVKA